MELGAAALIFGILAVMGISHIPNDYRKAAGGLLIAVTVAAIVIEGLILIAR